MAEWHYRLDKEVQGPLNEDDLKHIFDSGALPLTTPMWCEGMEDWVEAKRISILTMPPLPEASTKKQIQPPPDLPPHPRAKRFTIPVKWAVAGVTIACVLCLIVAGVWTMKNAIRKRKEVVLLDSNQWQNDEGKRINNDNLKQRGNRTRLVAQGNASKENMNGFPNRHAQNSNIVYADPQGIVVPSAEELKKGAKIQVVPQQQPERESAAHREDLKTNGKEADAPDAAKKALASRWVKIFKAYQTSQAIDTAGNKTSIPTSNSGHAKADASIVNNAFSEATDDPLSRWLEMLQEAIHAQSTEKGHLSLEYATACWALGCGLNYSPNWLTNYPNPVVGDHSKVISILTYVQGKLKMLNDHDEVILFYHPNTHLWAFKGKKGGYLLQFSDLDPTSAQIVTRPEQVFSIAHGRNVPSGRNEYLVRFTTKDSLKRVIMLGHDVLGIEGFNIRDNIELSCGFGPGDQQADRVAKAMAGIIFGYGGKGELVADSSVALSQTLTQTGSEPPGSDNLAADISNISPEDLHAVTSRGLTQVQALEVISLIHKYSFGSSSTVRTLPEEKYSRNAGFFMHVNRRTSKCSGKF